MRRTLGAAVAAMLLLAGWSVVRAQTRTVAASDADIMPALLEEVRGLRTALEQMSTAGPRVQLALGRLQLQEARMNTTIKRADDARTRLAQLQREQVELQEQVRGLISELKERATATDGPTAEQLAGMIKHHQQRLAIHNAEVQRVAAEEAMYATDVSNEQTRWTELNQRLEDLERALRPLK
jgi:hypothetical protein